MSWRRPEDLPESIGLPEFPGGIRDELREKREPEDLSCEVFGHVLALSEGELGAALEMFFRSITAFAALTDAILETNAIREANPSCPSQQDVEALAHDLWRGGFRVGFGVSWTPISTPGIAVGCRGAETEILDFLREHSEWKV